MFLKTFSWKKSKVERTEYARRVETRNSRRGAPKWHFRRHRVNLSPAPVAVSSLRRNPRWLTMVAAVNSLECSKQKIIVDDSWLFTDPSVLLPLVWTPRLWVSTNFPSCLPITRRKKICERSENKPWNNNFEVALIKTFHHNSIPGLIFVNVNKKCKNRLN